MKYLYLLLSTIILSSCVSQAMIGEEATAEDLTHTAIIQKLGAEKIELYVLANEWMIETFVSAESVIQFSDSNAGKIVGQYIDIIFDGVYHYDIKSKIVIDVKDEKYRIVFSEPTMRLKSDNAFVDKTWKNVTKKKAADLVQYKWSIMLHSFNTYIGKHQGKEDEW